MDGLSRPERILDLLQQRGEVSVADLAVALTTSEVTIRRDLAELGELGLLERKRGGARAVLRGEDIPYFLRERTREDAKERIVATAVQRIADGEAVLIDAGTTGCRAARLLAARRVTAMPLSVQAIAALGTTPPVSVHLPAGSVRPVEGSLTGAATERSIEALRFDTFLLGCCGLSASAGATAYDPQDAAVKQAGMRAAARTIAIVDGSKIGRETMAVVAQVQQLTLVITDDSADPAAAEALRALGVDVVTV